MQHTSIPACYFPSTALFLDDNRDFLLNFVLHLDEGLAYRMFDAPRKALKYVNNKPHELELLQHCFTENIKKKRPSTRHIINVDVAAIHKEVYNPHRFSEVSVIVFDYEMRGMDGLEFCRRIENPHIKKILLTGHGDEKLAVAAFNEGLIHQYVKKTDENAVEQISKSIAALQLQYFQEMSDMFTRILSIQSPCCLEDRKFAHFFQKFLTDHDIVEYYLIDNSGSFLLLDDDANVSLFILKNEEDIQEHVAFAYAKGLRGQLLSQISTGEKIPQYWQTNQVEPSLDEWSASLTSAKKLSGDKTYYYTYLTGSTAFHLRQKKILSYHRYLEEIDAEELLME